MLRSFLKKIIKNSVYKWFLKQKGCFKYFGETVFFPKNSTTFNVAIRDGIYEEEVLRLLVSNLKDNSVYFDIGANIGLMSIPVLKYNATVTVISVEASPTTFAFLKKTWQHSGFKERWTIYHNAVSNYSGEMDFFMSANADGSYESMKDTGRTTFSSKIIVAGITIDEIWTSSGKPMVSVIKSDIEGADLLALKGAGSCIDQCKPIIVLEWNPINIKPFQFQHQDLLDFCNDNNYRCYALPSIIPINNSTEIKLNAVFTENFLLAPVL